MSALHLLRTLTAPRQLDKDNLLFPCCGHSLYLQGDTAFGCPNGIDFSVSVEGDVVRIAGEDGREYSVGLAEWTRAVSDFSDAVSDFYQRSSPKQPPDWQVDAFSSFMDEWQRRRRAI